MLGASAGVGAGASIFAVASATLVSVKKIHQVRHITFSVSVISVPVFAKTQPTPNL